MTGKLVILSGPSGVGKDTVIDAWSARDSRVVRIVACTSREPRDGESDGESYHFLTKREFEEMIERGEFLEYKLVHGNLYGTPMKQLEDRLDQGKIAILKIDVQGAIDVMSVRPDAISIFLMPPSMEALERRIRGRATDDEATIERRLAGAKAELALADRYQHRVVNDRVARAVDEIQDIVEAG